MAFPHPPTLPAPASPFSLVVLSTELTARRRLFPSVMPGPVSFDSTATMQASRSVWTPPLIPRSVTPSASRQRRQRQIEERLFELRRLAHDPRQIRPAVTHH